MSLKRPPPLGNSPPSVTLDPNNMKGFGELSTPKEHVLLYVREVAAIVSPDNDDAIKKDCLKSKEGKIEFHGVKQLVGCEE